MSFILVFFILHLHYYKQKFSLKFSGFNFINENKQLTASSVSLMPKLLGTNYHYENKKVLDLLKKYNKSK